MKNSTYVGSSTIVLTGMFPPFRTFRVLRPLKLVSGVPSESIYYTQEYKKSTRVQAHQNADKTLCTQYQEFSFFNVFLPYPRYHHVVRKLLSLLNMIRRKVPFNRHCSTCKYKGIKNVYKFATIWLHLHLCNSPKVARKICLKLLKPYLLLSKNKKRGENRVVSGGNTGGLL